MYIKIPHRGTSIDHNFMELQKQGNPVIYDFVKLFEAHPHPSSDIIIEMGYKEAYGALLTAPTNPLVSFF